MKITKSQLKRLIKEELNTLNEGRVKGAWGEKEELLAMLVEAIYGGIRDAMSENIGHEYLSYDENMHNKVILEALDKVKEGFPVSGEEI